MANNNLSNAKKAKNDEFYTQYNDIEKEVSAYLEYDKNVFRGKTVLLPCDDPEWSNFTKFFAQKFKALRLKKLISTSYATASKNYKCRNRLTPFEKNNPRYDKNKSMNNGKIFTLTRGKSGAGKIDIGNLKWEYLKGDGDFRSDEVKQLCKEADIVITNPPFSLFREFLAWLVAANKKFLIIGNLNAITYKEVFPLLRDDKVWLGNNYKVNGGAMFYEIPKDIANLDQVREIKTDKNGKKVYITRVQGVRWFTNLKHGRLCQSLSLMTKADVIKFITKKPFDKYDNYNAIEVSLVKNIPSNYKGVMGVPISFFDKYNSEQFKILGSNRGVDQDANKIYGRGSYLNGKEVYKRIFIKHRRKTK